VKNHAFLINNFSRPSRHGGLAVVRRGCRKSRHFSRNILVVLAMTLIVGGGIFAGLKYFSRNANATLAGFDPGNIMDDATMANKNSMSEGAIQNFLNTKFANNYKGWSQNGYGVAISGWGTYHVDNGHFVPLAQESFGNNGLPAAGGQSAAHVIWQAAQDYSVNPQVLLVVLQKEQGLITDNFPNYTQYTSATGFGCPDTGPCDSATYGGFILQVRNAAAFFREVLNGGWSNYPVGQNYIRYNPNVACGGSVINVQNRATSALYRYTPYQPNAAALSVPMGTVVDCGAYGNKNFYDYFTSWFGSTRVQGAAGLMGNIENVSYLNGNILISGWTFDYANINQPNNVDVYIGGPSNSSNVVGSTRIYVGNLSPDVDNIFGIAGNHRFSVSIPFNSCDGTYQIYIYNIGLGDYHSDLFNTSLYLSGPSNETCVYRLYNPASGDHFYTTSLDEKNQLANSGSWNYESVAWYGF
jgi:hypothetical protein